MQLSDPEQKLVTRLQRQQQSFIRWRWVGLLSACTAFGCGIYGGWVSLQCIRPDVLSATVLALVFPVSLWMFCLGAWQMGYVIVNWNGKPETRLLLKLIESLRGDASK